MVETNTANKDTRNLRGLGCFNDHKPNANKMIIIIRKNGGILRRKIILKQ